MPFITWGVVTWEDVSIIEYPASPLESPPRPPFHLRGGQFTLSHHYHTGVILEKWTVKKKNVRSPRKLESPRQKEGIIVTEPRFLTPSNTKKKKTIWKPACGSFLLWVVNSRAMGVGSQPHRLFPNIFRTVPDTDVKHAYLLILTIWHFQRNWKKSRVFFF